MKQKGTTRVKVYVARGMRYFLCYPLAFLLFIFSLRGGVFFCGVYFLFDSVRT